MVDAGNLSVTNYVCVWDKSSIFCIKMKNIENWDIAGY